MNRSRNAKDSGEPPRHTVTSVRWWVVATVLLPPLAIAVGFWFGLRGAVADGLASEAWLALGAAAIGVGWAWLTGGWLGLTPRRVRGALGDIDTVHQVLFEHGPLPMWVYDRESLRFLAVNAAAIAQYGYSREQFLAMSILAIRPEAEWPRIREAARRPLSPEDLSHTWTHLTADGRLREVAVHARDIDFRGTPARLVVVEDVTEQIRAERERHRHEERFQLVARATNDAIWDWDLANDHLWWSDSYFELFGFSRGSLAPTFAAWEERVHPDDLARVNAGLERVLASDETEWRDEYRFRREDGSWAQVEDRGFLRRDGQGRPVRFVGGVVDVSERRRQEADLRLLRRAVAATENAVLIADARAEDQPIVYANPAFERMTGYTAEEVIGRNCRFLQGDDRDQPGIEGLRAVLREGGEAELLLRNYRKDGERFLNELRISPVRDAGGELTHFVAVLNDVTEREHHQQMLAHRATHDELTGLPNRQLLLDRLGQAILMAERYGRRVGVLFIDLDNFKLINDTLGHAVGDQVLRQVADRFHVALRESDTVGRFGGDEFVAVLSEQVGESGVEAVIARLFGAMAEPVRTDDGGLHYLTPSVGYCRYPEDGSDPEALLMRADIAMYKAKQRGRNCAVAYDQSFDAGVADRLQLVSQLREALLREEFVLHFQPQYGADGALRGLEALLRWQHPERGLLAPVEFVGVCEDSGLIAPLGRWVLNEAARHGRLLAAHGHGQVRISVNVSAAQFQSELYEEVRAALAAHGLPGQALELELTESVVMANPEATIETMRRLSALGVSIAIDDFGTGYSSLAYLKRLPIDRLKIDRSFVSDLEHDGDDRAICASVISLARSLALATTAEGVETEAQRDWLLQRGCDELQGYLLGRPAPFAEILHAIAAVVPAK